MEYIFKKAETRRWITGINGKAYRRKRLLDMMKRLPTNETRRCIMRLLGQEGSIAEHVEEDAALREFKGFTHPTLFWKWKDGDLFLLKKMMHPLGTDPKPGESDRIEQTDSLTWFRSKMQ